MTKYKIFLTIDDVLKENGLSQKEVYTSGNMRAATFGQYYNNRIARIDLKVMADILESINDITEKDYDICDLVKSEKIES